MAKPILITIVIAAPLISGGAYCAFSEENNGESAVTDIPHINKNTINKGNDGFNNINGDNKQQQQDVANAMVAVLFVPSHCEMIPPNAQETPPDAMTKNDTNDVLK
jgi:hypothetical protein